MEEVTNIPEWFTDHMDEPTGYLDEVGKLQPQGVHYLGNVSWFCSGNATAFGYLEIHFHFGLPTERFEKNIFP